MDTLTIGSYVIATLGTLRLGGTILMIIKAGDTLEYCVMTLDGHTIRTKEVEYRA